MQVAFSIDQKGTLISVALAASSGSASLDDAAIDLIRRAQPFPAPPARLGASVLSFVVPVRYLAVADRLAALTDGLFDRRQRWVRERAIRAALRQSQAPGYLRPAFRNGGEPTTSLRPRQLTWALNFISTRGRCQ